MPSRLSSLLVRDGLVGVKRMEKAFQRQVIYGGSLDTILLEMSLVPEERLTQYLALASGLPPAARDEGNTIDAAAIALVARELSAKYRAVPVALEGEAVRVLVCSPLEITELEDLADLIDRPLQPLITPEYRWNLVFAAAYQIDPPARFTTLARTLDVDSTTQPVGRARTVIIDESSRPSSLPAAVAAAAPSAFAGNLTGTLQSAATADTTLKFAAAAVQQDSEPTPVLVPMPVPAPPVIPATAPPVAAGQGGGDFDVEEPTLSDPTDYQRVGFDSDQLPPLAPDGKRRHRGTMVGVTPNLASTDELMYPASGVPAVPRREPEREEPLPPVVTYVHPGMHSNLTPSSGVPAPVGMIETRPSRKIDSTTAGKLPHGTSQPIPTLGRDAPLPIIQARELLATAEDRDTIFLTLLRAARARARWAGLLTVQGGAAIGRVALAEPTLDTAQLSTVMIPLDVRSPFRSTVQTGQPYVGPITCGDAGVDSMLLRFGGVAPPSALLLPIVLRERVVALVVAHRVLSDTRLVDVTELLPMATAAADAIGRLLVKSKAAGYRTPEPSEAPPVEIPAEIIDKKVGGDTKKLPSADEAWRAPSGVMPQVTGLEPEENEVSITADPPTPIKSIVDAIEAGAEGETDELIAEAVERASETLGELNGRFPGKLRVDRFAVNGRALRAAQYGGLLELVIGLGTASSELLIEKMAAAQRDIRFYATVCCAELRPRNAVFALAERLFDQDFGVRACAIEALAGYPMSELGHALVRTRRAMHSLDPDVVGAAAAAAVALGDVESVGDLIGALERGDRAAEHARRALVTLTAQDFGTSERKWRKWYETGKKRHRIEWLIDGLAHKEDAIRESAINDLRRITGEYFGYHYDLPRRDRDASAARWASWWRDAGQRRFLAKEDERLRPTAQLPARHDPE